MLDQLFDEGSGYYEYPSFEVAIFSLLLAFVLSTVIALTYKFTYKGKILPNHFFQAIVLSSIVTSMIMMAVGNNFAVGFGIIGAVAIIRFRTLIRDPRNIIFMFAGISVGIAAGVYGYSIAVAGTIVFSIVAVLLSISSYGEPPEFDFDVTIDYSIEKFTGDLNQLLEPFCKSFTLESQRRSKSSHQMTYIVRLKEKISYELLFKELGSVEGITRVRVSKNEERKKL
jgi:uncharacterized membrane protein YhiD involved in acid resistance